MVRPFWWISHDIFLSKTCLLTCLDQKHILSCFELPFRSPIVNKVFIGCCRCSFVYKTLRDTHYSVGSLILIYNYICGCCCQLFYSALENCVVLCFQRWCYRANLQLVTVKLFKLKILLFVVLGEVLPHKLDEQFTSSCFLILAIWWVQPYDLSVSVSSSVLSIAIIIIH